MKRCILIFSLTLLAIFSCREQEPDLGFSPGKEVELSPNQTLWSNNNQISVKILEITDSRCPLLYECFWQGEARVKIKLTHIGTYTFELSTFFNQADTIQSLSFRLVKVEPYPTGNETIDLEDYRVTLEIKEI